MLKKLLLISLLLVSTANAQSLSKQFNHLSQKQIAVLKQSFRYGINDNLQFSLVAISWKESNFGKWIVNFQDKGGGWFGVRVRTAIRRLTPKMRMTGFNLNRVGSWLINDPAFSAKMAILELKYWLRRYKGNYMKAWSGFNGGNKGNMHYARDIAHKVRFLKRHLLVK